MGMVKNGMMNWPVIRKTSLLSSIVVGFCLASPLSGAEPNVLHLDGIQWHYFSEDAEAPVSRAAHIRLEDANRRESRGQNGSGRNRRAVEPSKVLHITGEPLGYLYTAKKYTSFVMTFQYRRPVPEMPGKGGVLIRTTGEHKIWPKSLEAQLNYGNAGDFWGLDGYPLEGPEDRMKTIDSEKFGRLTNLAKVESVELEPGEWNTYEIRAQGTTVTLSINGKQVNRAQRCPVVQGTICLTAEGDPIEFRNIRIDGLP